METFFENPGYLHIGEKILLNSDPKTLASCYAVSPLRENILDGNPNFWQKYGNLRSLKVYLERFPNDRIAIQWKFWYRQIKHTHYEQNLLSLFSKMDKSAPESPLKIGLRTFYSEGSSNCYFCGEDLTQPFPVPTFQDKIKNHHFDHYLEQCRELDWQNRRSEFDQQPSSKKKEYKKTWSKGDAAIHETLDSKEAMMLIENLKLRW